MANIKVNIKVIKWSPPSLFYCIFQETSCPCQNNEWGTMTNSTLPTLIPDYVMEVIYWPLIFSFFFPMPPFQEVWGRVLCYAGQDRRPSLQWKQHWAGNSLRKILQGVHTGHHWPRWVSRRTTPRSLHASFIGQTALHRGARCVSWVIFRFYICSGKLLRSTWRYAQLKHWCKWDYSERGQCSEHTPNIQDFFLKQISLWCISDVYQ